MVQHLYGSDFSTTYVVSTFSRLWNSDRSIRNSRTAATTFAIAVRLMQPTKTSKKWGWFTLTLASCVYHCLFNDQVESREEEERDSVSLDIVEWFTCHKRKRRFPLDFFPLDESSLEISIIIKLPCVLHLQFVFWFLIRYKIIYIYLM